MGKLTAKKEQNFWIVSIILFVICIGIALTFYIPVIDHIFDVVAPTELEDGVIDPPPDPYLFTVREISPDPNFLFSIGEIIQNLTFGFLDLIDVTILAVLALLIIPAWAYHSDQKWRDDIDDHIPSLLREISDAQKTGLPLPRAIMESSKHQYGALTPELKKMASKISWGIPFSKALRSLTETADTPLMKRTSLLILEAERSGGAIEDVFESAHKHVSEVLGLKRERLGAMRPYTWIIYASFIVFAIVMIILLYSFFLTLATQMVDAVRSGEDPATALPFNVAGLQLLFFHLMVIEAVFAGLIAGKMGDGNAKIGLRHSCILLVLCYVFFKITIIIL
jgi:flagellar protein FlaJ